MKEYLKNDICNFKPLFKIDYSKKENIYSASFFKLKSGSYKDFSKYTNGLKYLDKHINILKNFRIRLFIEKSIYEDKDLMKLLRGLKNTDLVLYTCPDFVEDTIYHKGLFSTLVRIFPLFNFSNNDSNIVKITDIDYSEKFLLNNVFPPITKLLKNINTKNIVFISQGFYHFNEKNLTKPTLYNIRKNYLTPFFMADQILSLGKKYDHNYLYKALKDKNYDNKFNKIYSNFHLSYRKQNIKWDYGLDEFYSNITLVNELIKNKEPFNYFLRSLSILQNLFVNIKIDKKSYKDYERFFKTILKGDPKFKFISIEKSYDYLDNLIYPNLKNKNNSKKILDIIFNIYGYYITIYKEKIIDYYNKDFIHLILSEQFLGVYYTGNIITGYNIKGLKTSLSNPNRLPKNYIKELKDLKKHFNVNTLKLKIPDLNYKI